MIKKLFIIIFFVVFHANLTKADLVKDIEIIGNKRVSKETIQVYGEISNNKNYSQKDLDRVLKNLYNTNFLKDVTIEIISNKLKIIVVEHNYKSTNNSRRS